MADLITPAELALWTRNDVEDVVADPLAADVMKKVSDLARFLGGHPEWTYGEAPETEAPFDVLMLVLKICKRTYANLEQVVAEGNVGPIGGDRFLDAAALLTDLTETERKTLTKYNTEGDPDAEKVELWVQPTTRGPLETQSAAILYMSDNMQINMHEEQSAYPSWDIPMFSPGDPGDPNLYD